MNTYGYVGGNPLIRIDPYGLFFDEATFTALLEGASTTTGIATSAIVAGVGGVVAAALPSSAGEGSDQPPMQCEDDPCIALLARVKAIAAELRRQYYRGLDDHNELYDKARQIPNLGRRKGTWLGHIEKFNNTRKALNYAMAEAEAAGCKVDPFDKFLLSLEYPARPAQR